MSSNLRKSVFSVMDALILPSLTLISIPIFINKLGVNDFGIWMFISSLLILVSVMNFGGPETVVRYISFHVGRQDRRSSNEAFNVVSWVLLVVFIFISIFSFYIPAMLLQEGYFNINSGSEDLFRGSLQFGMILAALKLLEQHVFSYFKGLEKFDLLFYFSLPSKITLIGVQLVVVINGGSLIEVFKYSCIILTVNIVAQFIFMRMMLDIHFLSKFNMLTAKEMFSFAKWSWIAAILAIISSQVDKWIIASNLTMEDLGYYSLALVIFTSIHAVIASGVIWVFPKTSREEGGKNFMSDYYILQGTIIFISITISYILIFYDNIFIFWLGEEPYHNSIELIKFILLWLPIYAVSIVPYYITQGKGVVKYNSYMFLAEITIKYILVTYMLDLYGLYGVILAIGLSTLFISFSLSAVLKYKVCSDCRVSILGFLTIPIAYIIGMLTIQSELNFLIYILLILLTYFYTKNQLRKINY